MIDYGVIGCGVMGQNHIRVLSTMRGIDDIYVYDTDKNLMKKVADAYGCKTCEELDTIAIVSNVVSVCVPNNYHIPVAKTVIDNNKNSYILIEKPMSSNYQDIYEFLKYCDGPKRIGVGHIERFNPILPEIKHIVNTYGNPLYIEFKRHNPSSSRITSGTVVEDLMIHDIDVALSIFNDDIDIKCAAGNSDICNVIGNLKLHHVPVIFSASRKSSKKIRSIYIECEDFTIEGDYMSQEIIVYNKPDKYESTHDRFTQDNIVEKVMVRKVEPLRVELETIVKCYNDNTQFPVTPIDAMMCMKLCDKIKSMI